LAIGVAVYFSYWSLSHLPFRSNDLRHGRCVSSRSLECQRKVLIFSMGPWSRSFHTACTDFMWKWNPWFFIP